jgi:hypothetical protein
MELPVLSQSESPGIHRVYWNFDLSSGSQLYETPGWSLKRYYRIPTPLRGHLAAENR